MHIDDKLVTIFNSGKYVIYNYPEYFEPEIINYINTKYKSKCLLKSFPQIFYDNRKKEMDQDELKNIIQNDLIDDFILYIESHYKESYEMPEYFNRKVEKFTIKPSIFESNTLLLENAEIQIIEYAAFCGSCEIFRSLITDGVELTPKIWMYAAHGNSMKLIAILYEYDSNRYLNNKVLGFKEAIKCHHDEIAYFIQSSFLSEKDMSNSIENDYNENIYSYAFQYYNFEYFPIDFQNKFIFHYACQYDYYLICSFIMGNKMVDYEYKVIK